MKQDKESIQQRAKLKHLHKCFVFFSSRAQAADITELKQ